MTRPSRLSRAAVSWHSSVWCVTPSTQAETHVQQLHVHEGGDGFFRNKIEGYGERSPHLRRMWRCRLPLRSPWRTFISWLPWLPCIVGWLITPTLCREANFVRGLNPPQFLSLDDRMIKKFNDVSCLKKNKTKNKSLTKQGSPSLQEFSGIICIPS